MTRTHAILNVSPSTYAEIRAKLDVAGYQHAFLDCSDGERIDMHGIAVRVTPGEERHRVCCFDGCGGDATHTVLHEPYTNACDEHVERLRPWVSDDLLVGFAADKVKE